MSYLACRIASIECTSAAAAGGGLDESDDAALCDWQGARATNERAMAQRVGVMWTNNIFATVKPLALVRRFDRRQKPPRVVVIFHHQNQHAPTYGQLVLRGNLPTIREK
jgi:hypothetical protein